MDAPVSSPRLRSTTFVLPEASIRTTVDVRVPYNRTVDDDDGGRDLLHCHGQLAHNDTGAGVIGTQTRAMARHHHGLWLAYDFARIG